jgi:anti-sigma B factor antagonist
MEHHEFLIENSQVIANLTGSLQGAVAAQLRETLLTYIANGYNSFTMDFSHVTNIDSTGLGILVTIQKRALQSGGNLAIQGLHGTVKTAFDRTRLSKAFTIADTDHAIA